MPDLTTVDFRQQTTIPCVPVCGAVCVCAFAWALWAGRATSLVTALATVPSLRSPFLCVPQQAPFVFPTRSGPDPLQHSSFDKSLHLAAFGPGGGGYIQLQVLCRTTPQARDPVPGSPRVPYTIDSLCYSPGGVATASLPASFRRPLPTGIIESQVLNPPHLTPWPGPAPGPERHFRVCMAMHLAHEQTPLSQPQPIICRTRK